MTLREIAMYYKIKQSKQEADKYKQQSDLYESVLKGNVTEFVVPAEWTKIRQGAFNTCKYLVSITILNGIVSIEATSFASCTSLKNINIPESVTAIKSSAFFSCSSLTTINIPNAVTLLGTDVFKNCSNLTNVTLGDNFNCNNLDLSASTKYSTDTLVAMLTALADRSNQSAYTLTLGAPNLAKLSNAQKAIATDKNWTLA